MNLAVSGETVADLRARIDAPALPGRVAILLLAGFHAWLFWSHLVDGRLLDPAVAMRWVAGLLLVAGFAGLRHLGIPLIRGRKAVVLWLLVALLHVHAAWTPPGALAERGAMGEALATVVLQAASATALLGIGLVLLAIALRPRAHGFRSPAWFAQQVAFSSRPADGCLLLLSPRPPPLC